MRNRVGPTRRASIEIGIADEIGDEACGRPLVNLRGRSELKDFAGVHDGDPIRHRQRLMLIMRDEDEGDADFVLQPLELELHSGP